MVRGLKKFSEYFSGMEGSYVLIGGAASLPQDDFIKRAGASGITVPEVIVRIKEAFGL